MLALIQKIEAADATHFASLGESAKKESAPAKTKTLEKSGEPPRRARSPSSQEEAQHPSGEEIHSRAPPKNAGDYSQDRRSDRFGQRPRGVA